MSTRAILAQSTPNGVVCKSARADLTDRPLRRRSRNESRKTDKFRSRVRHPSTAIADSRPACDRSSSSASSVTTRWLTGWATGSWLSSGTDGAASDSGAGPLWGRARYVPLPCDPSGCVQCCEGGYAGQEPIPEVSSDSELPARPQTYRREGVRAPRRGVIVRSDGRYPSYAAVDPDSITTATVTTVLIKRCRIVLTERCDDITK